MTPTIYIIGAIVLLGGIGLLFLLPGSGSAATRRLNSIRLRHSDSASVKVEQQMRKAVASRRPLNMASASGMTRTDKLRIRLEQTGKKWTVKQYYNASMGLAATVLALTFVKGAPIYLALVLGLFAGIALPHFVISYLIGKRVKLFTASFPDAIELIVRGLKSGLPVAETLNMISREFNGPIGEEFKMVTEKIKIGKTMEAALHETADRMGTAEFQFFVITLAIQRETGGNLSETLANLATVLRTRAQMKLKIRAMSSESKASAYIVGSLPFFVFGMIWQINPGYLAGFFYEERLIIAGLGALVWISLGAFIMSRMVSFEI
jgi:tight adherence protein B